MKKITKRIISLSIVLTLLIGLINGKVIYAEETTNELTAEQRNAIEMLNYITVLTQEINDSKNSRIYMEQAYSSLINNTNPNAVDSRTLSQMTGLLDTMENYRMINVKRERLQYIYDQNQAKAIRAAIPNPMGLLSSVRSFNWVTLVASVAYMAVDSATSYKAYTTEVEQQYLQDGWALDDEESNVLHESSKGTFSYMVKMVKDYDMPQGVTLTPDSVEELVKWKNNNNLIGRIRFLESNKKTYQSYGGYWLALAESYYDNGEYDKCLDAIDTYEQIGIRIFRRDYNYAKVLPLAIASAKQTKKTRFKYAVYAKDRAQRIIDNTDHNDWALRYFAAQTFVDLYAETKDKKYLDDAYDIILDNVIYLLEEQKKQNDAYKAPVQEMTASKDATKAEKEEIKKYNKMQKESRETEMPPIYEPLVLNCNLLFAIADEKKITSAEKKKIDNMLRPDGNDLFLVKPIDNLFRFDKTSINSPTMILDKSGILLPAMYFTKDSRIQVEVLNSSGTAVAKFIDWKIDEVDRKTEGSIDSFDVKYISSRFDDFDWEPNMKVKVDVSCMDGLDIKYHFDFKTIGTKNVWYEYGKVWESEIKFETD